MSKVDEMLKVTRLRELVLDLGKSSYREGNETLIFRIDTQTGDIIASQYQKGPYQLWIPKEHALSIAEWILENYGSNK